jgi:deoxyribodipyrimidine photo-lyase
VRALVDETKAAAVFWNRRYEPFAIEADAALKGALLRDGVEATSFKGALLFEPWEVKTGAGGHFKVYSPFWRACLARGVDGTALPAPDRIAAPADLPRSDDLAAWKLLPTKPDWAGGMRASWVPGEVGALAKLDALRESRLLGYAAQRNRPDLPQTSRLSPHLHWGEISPRQVWDAAHAVAHAHAASSKDVEKFVSEIGWREFSHHLLYYAPALPERNWRESFDRFPWASDPDGLEAWRRGCTGYPIVDAGMRELWTTGWMHNRVRMVVASFLIKDLLIHWREGAAWFWDTLVDADLANNAASWQWVAGSGADAAPYFRVFNPVSQGETYDPSGDYVRRWVPELAKLPNAHIHAPWLASSATLAAAGVTLGETYPKPIIDHGKARVRALAAFETLTTAN